MIIANYPSERQPVASLQEVSVAQLLTKLSQHDEREEKLGSPAWAPTRLTTCPPVCHNHGLAKKLDCGGGKYHRHEKNVLAHSCLVFDVDHLQPDQMELLGAALTASKIQGVIHSTHSHDEASGEYNARIILITDREIPAEHVRQVRAALVAKLDIPVDPATKDLSRLYYLPSHLPGASYFTLPLEGEPVVVDQIVNLPAPIPQVNPKPAVTPTATNPPPTPAATATALQTTTVIDIASLRERLKDIDTPDGKLIAKRVLEGEALAPRGQHDTTLQKLSGLMATWLPPETPFDAILHLCELALRKMDWEDGWDHLVEQFEDKYERAVARTAQFREQRKAAQDAISKAWRLKAVEATENPLARKATEDGFYTPEALAEWSVGEKEWIVQKGETYFVFRNGTYIARGKAEIGNSLNMDLARAPIELTVETKKGSRDMTTTEVVQTYGTVADGITSSVILQHSYYDPKTGLFHEAVKPMRPLEPQEYPEIHEWLKLLGASDTERFLDWMACVTRLDRQCCALYIHGFPGAGKTVLAHGLARLWTTGAPSDLRRVLGAFNDTLCECPLVFADESLPNTRTISEDLRELIGSTTRSLHRKYMPSSSLQGAVRLIICGNNPDMLRPSNDMTEFDLDAVAERFLPLEAPKAAAEYLKELGGPPVVNKWITEDKLARHVLWLAKTRTVKASNSRFLVVGQKDRFHERLAVNSGVGAAVCEILVQLLNSKTKLPPHLKDLVLIGEGKLLVNANALKPIWLEYMQQTPPPTTQRLSKALAAISTKLNPIRVNGEQRRYSQVRVEQLISWADESGMSLREAIIAKLDVPNDLISGKKQLAEKGSKP